MTEDKSIEWSTENRLQLLQAIAKVIPEPKKDNISYHTRLLKLDWSSIQIAGFGTDQVKNEFNHLIGRVRRMRTLNEILGDLFIILKPPENRTQSLNTRRICMCPHRKLNLFQWFSNRKRSQVRAQNPDMPPQQLMRDLGAHFRALDPEARAKYEVKFAKHLAKVDRQMAEYRALHPDFFCPQHDHVKIDRKRRTSSGPSDVQSDTEAQVTDTARPRLPRPVDMYMNHKLERKGERSESQKKALRSKYKAKYEKLSDRKRLKWVERVATSMGQYAEAAKEYKKKDAKFKPIVDIGAVLTTREKDLFDAAHPGERIGGRFVSGYNMFSREMYENPSQELTQVAPKERMKAIANLWHALLQEQRDEYNRRAEALREQSNLRFGVQPGRRRAARIAKSAPSSPVKQNSLSNAPPTPSSAVKQESGTATAAGGAKSSAKAHASKTKTKASQKAATATTGSSSASATNSGGGTKTKASAKLEVDHVFGREGESDSSVEEVDGDESSGDDESDEPNANLNLQKASALNLSLSLTHPQPHQAPSPAASVRSSTAIASAASRPTRPLALLHPAAVSSIIKEDESSSEDDDDDDDDPAPLTIALPSAPPRKPVAAVASSSSAATASRGAQPVAAAAAAAAVGESSSSEASGSESGSESESEQEDGLLSQVPATNMAYAQFVAQTLGKQTAQQQQHQQKAAAAPVSAASSAKLPLAEWSAAKQPTGTGRGVSAMPMPMNELQAARKHKPHTLPTMVAPEPIFMVPPKKSKRQEQPVA